jgi:hypothetical protein
MDETAVSELVAAVTKLDMKDKLCRQMVNIKFQRRQMPLVSRVNVENMQKVVPTIDPISTGTCQEQA